MELVALPCQTAQQVHDPGSAVFGIRVKSAVLSVGCSAGLLVRVDGRECPGRCRVGPTRNKETGDGDKMLSTRRQTYFS